MSVIMFIIALTVFIRICGGFLVIEKAVTKGRPGIREILIALMVAAGAAAAEYFVGTTQIKYYIIPAAELLCLWFCGRYLWKGEKRKTLFFAIFFEMASFLAATLLRALFTVLVADVTYMDMLSLKGSVVCLVSTVPVFLVSLAIYSLNNVSERVWFRLGLAAAMLSVLFINYLTSIENPLIDREEVSSWLYYAIVLLVLIFVVQMNKHYNTEKELARMKSDEAMMLEREYTSLSRSYESNAKLFHDFRNHCGMLKNFLTKGKTDEAIAYLDELVGESSTFKACVWTGDETVDYLISIKKALAEEKGIAFEAEVEFPRNTNIKSSDLCAILGNLLDNAIEACVKVAEPSDRKIRLVIRRIRQMMVIKLENTYARAPIVKDGEIKTSKTDGGLHGWGIKSAGTAAEKYDGTINSSCDDKLFTTVVTLSFDGVKVS